MLCISIVDVVLNREGGPTQPTHRNKTVTEKNSLTAEVRSILLIEHGRYPTTIVFFRKPANLPASCLRQALSHLVLVM